ncbi:hypothetical protein SAMN05661080_00754 [Modestobacter sp. DSM 44400]|uniref:type II toxin-antitoxin system VapC family toxin n=1 Tax=Modestobacter sp. DSM 44400 TaxID=1550230 RepID=UPI0008946E5C|nr:TA system VapC family ribonuclease toxin [Modestobacter sp. DSM 44400]SDX66744.1 hypothetical protein SAMN05661080_00754 [Modestobacter sp. DSM 44400]
MIALDTNLLVYAHRPDTPEFGRASSAVASLLETSEERVGIPAPCIGEFLTVVTGRRLSSDPTPLTRALAQVDAWLNAPVAQVIGERAGYWPLLRGLLERSGFTGARIHDARIAAICLDHGVREFWTADRDYGWFPELRTRNPLVGG